MSHAANMEDFFVAIWCKHNAYLTEMEFTVHFHEFLLKRILSIMMDFFLNFGFQYFVPNILDTPVHINEDFSLKFQSLLIFYINKCVGVIGFDYWTI